MPHQNSVLQITPRFLIQRQLHVTKDTYQAQFMVSDLQIKTLKYKILKFRSNLDNDLPIFANALHL